MLLTIVNRVDQNIDAMCKLSLAESKAPAYTPCKLANTLHALAAVIIVSTKEKGGHYGDEESSVAHAQC